MSKYPALLEACLRAPCQAAALAPVSTTVRDCPPSPQLQQPASHLAHGSRWPSDTCVLAGRPPAPPPSRIGSAPCAPVGQPGGPAAQAARFETCQAQRSQSALAAPHPSLAPSASIDACLRVQHGAAVDRPAACPQPPASTVHTDAWPWPRADVAPAQPDFAGAFSRNPVGLAPGGPGAPSGGASSGAGHKRKLMSDSEEDDDRLHEMAPVAPLAATAQPLNVVAELHPGAARLRVPLA